MKSKKKNGNGTNILVIIMIISADEFIYNVMKHIKSIHIDRSISSH